MDEERKRGWDVVLGVLAPVLTVAGIFVGVLEFTTQERNNIVAQDTARRADARLEFGRHLWLERIDQYKAVGSIVGRIASNEDEVKMKGLIAQFYAVYWGNMVLVEDRNVEREMHRFEFEVRLHQRYPNEGSDRLKRRAYELIGALRTSIAKSAPEQ